MSCTDRRPVETADPRADSLLKLARLAREGPNQSRDRRDGLTFRTFPPCARPTPLPDGRYPARPVEAQLSRQMPKAREGDPRKHRADACESVQVTSNYMTNLG